jgi:23S rRNA (adenine2503-C2)-methyltransferase
MTNLPHALRDELAGRFFLFGSTVTQTVPGDDGTVKLQITLHDGATVEAVMLRDGAGRLTACLSSQSGCAMGCVFCKTGARGLRRSLEAPEMVEQLLHINALAKNNTDSAGSESASAMEKGGISNIVFMGMGEPLGNLEQLRQAIAVITAPLAAAFSPRRVTVSTCGIIDGIRDLAEKGPPVRLAVSLPTARPELRERLMPAAAANPLPALRDALVYYQEKSGRRVTLEVVLLGGVNTTVADAAALAAFIRGTQNSPPLTVMVNLIPWNAVAGLSLEGRPLCAPAEAEIVRFTAELEKRRVKTERRLSKGGAVAGACGQLG